MVLEHRIYMEQALKEANKAYLKGEVPVGAVLMYKGTIIARGYNRRESTHDITSHAEIEVLRKGGQFFKNHHLQDTVLYVTLEPCPMCLGAILQSGVSTLVYGATDKKMGAVESYMKIAEFPTFKGFQVIGGILEKKCREILQEFFKKLRL